MVDRSQVERVWRERGFSCELWVDLPGQRWEDFTHPSDELFMVLEGDVEVELLGKIMQPAAGEEVLIPAGARHSVRNRGATVSRWLYGYRR